MAQKFFKRGLDCVEYSDNCINASASMSMTFQYPYFMVCGRQAWTALFFCSLLVNQSNSSR